MLRRCLVDTALAVAVAGCDSGGGAGSGSTSASSTETSTTSQSVFAEVRTDEGRKVFTMGDFGLVVDDALSPQIRPVDLPPCG
jgi:hypothetical protein